MNELEELNIYDNLKTSVNSYPKENLVVVLYAVFFYYNADNLLLF